MKAYLVVAAVTLAVVLVGCVTVEEKQSKLVSSYIELHPNILPDIRAALLEGKVIPGMSDEEAFIASGIAAKGYSDYSIWVVTQDKRHVLPPTVLPTGATVAITTKNNTQFDSSDEREFVIYLNSGGRVTKVEQSKSSSR